MSALTRNLCVTVLLLGFCCIFLSAASENKNNLWTRSPGENVTLKCTTDGQYDSLYVRLRRPEMLEMLFLNKHDVETIPIEYKERVSIKGGKKNLTVTITNLQTNDSGVYWCEYSNFQKPGDPQQTGSVLLQVIEHKPTEQPPSTSKPQVIVPGVVLCSAMLLIGLVVGLWVIPKMKACCRRSQNESSKEGIYVDMRASRRYTGNS